MYEVFIRDGPLHQVWTVYDLANYALDRVSICSASILIDVVDVEFRDAHFVITNMTVVASGRKIERHSIAYIDHVTAFKAL